MNVCMHMYVYTYLNIFMHTYGCTVHIYYIHMYIHILLYLYRDVGLMVTCAPCAFCLFIRLIENSFHSITCCAYVHVCHCTHMH